MLFYGLLSVAIYICIVCTASAKAQQNSGGTEHGNENGQQLGLHQGEGWVQKTQQVNVGVDF